MRSGSKGIPRKNMRLSAEKPEGSPNERGVHVSQVRGTLFILGGGINMNKDADGSDGK